MCPVKVRDAVLVDVLDQNQLAIKKHHAPPEDDDSSSDEEKVEEEETSVPKVKTKCSW